MGNKPQGIAEDDGRVGVNFNTQNLRCLIVLHDQLAKVMSENAGDAFFRAFVVEDRETGEVFVKQRFRYRNGDSWYEMHLTPEQQKLPIDERIQFMVKGIKKVMLQGMEMLGGAHISKSLAKQAIMCFYPPKPEDHKSTMDWLIAQDLIEVKSLR
jgi:hypothetical protein